MKRFTIYGLTAAAIVTMMSMTPTTAFGAVRVGVKPYMGAYANTCAASVIIGGVQRPGNGAVQDAASERITELVNAERRKAGMSPLTANAGVQAAAQVRAEEIARVFSHTRPDGSSYAAALSEAGAVYRASGENIAYGQNSPEAVMEAWMNSSGHRANILSGDYSSIGIGHFKDTAGTDYWVQLFTD